MHRHLLLLASFLPLACADDSGDATSLGDGSSDSGGTASTTSSATTSVGTTSVPTTGPTTLAPGTEASSTATLGSGTDTDSGPDTDSASGTDTDSGLETESASGTATDSAPDTDSASGTGTDAGPDTDSASGTDTDAGPDTDSASGSEDTQGTDGVETGTSSTGGDTEGPAVVNLQLLAFNDFHGNLVSPGNFADVPAGGAAALAHHVQTLRATEPNTLVVSAGDLIGASPLVSALYHDEPTIDVMDMLGLDLNAVGNHEFDDGYQELLRMQHGGCHPEDGCTGPFATEFDGASFEFLAANVTYTDSGETLFPAYRIHEFGGVAVAFIGMTLEGTPEIVTPSGVAGLTFADEIETVNALVPELQAAGVEAIVVLIHEGGLASGDIDGCDGISGPIVSIVEGVDDAVDVFVTGHTHQAYNCRIDDKLVTSAGSFGRVLTDIDLELDPVGGDILSAQAQNLVVTREAEVAEIRTYVEAYVEDSATLAQAEIGRITTTFDRTAGAGGQSTLGSLIADAQLEAASLSGAHVAFMNPGGVRADLVFEASPTEAEDGIVTYGEAFTTQPFGNSLVVMTLTGAQLDTLLETQFAVGRMLQVSEGFEYAFSESAEIGNRVAEGAMRLDGIPIEPDDEVRIVVNSFLATGGDGFAVLNDGIDRVGGDLDLDALQDYFLAYSPVSPNTTPRVQALP